MSETVNKKTVVQEEKIAKLRGRFIKLLAFHYPNRGLSNDTRRALNDMSEEDLRKAIQNHQNPWTLEMHEMYFSNKLGLTIIQVPSGWLYQDHDETTGYINSSTFVPFEKHP